MFKCSGLPCVELTTVDGKHLRMAIDTGDDASIMDVSLAKELGLKITGPKEAGDKPTDGNEFIVLPGVRIGGASLGDLKVSVLPGIAARMSRDRMPAADGLLAYTAFEGRLLELDYRNRQVRISEPLGTAPDCFGYCASLSTPTFGRGGPAVLVADGFSVNGNAVSAQIDTLFSGTMLVYSTVVEKLGLGKAALTNRKQFFKYTDGGVDMLEGRARVLTFGRYMLAKDAPIYFPTAGVHQPDGMFDTCVGQALFEHSTVHIDLRGMKIWFSR
jgi:hypothetical protein